jgi:hypothetical protein
LNIHKLSAEPLGRLNIQVFRGFRTCLVRKVEELMEEMKSFKSEKEAKPMRTKSMKAKK